MTIGIEDASCRNMSIQVPRHRSMKGNLILDYFYGMQNVLKRPSRPAGNNLCPNLFGNGIVGVK